jgi:hypothetical protein
MSAADLLPVTSSRRVVSSVFVAVLVTFLTHVRDVGESSSLEQSPRGISTHQAGDMMSLLQDARIQVEFNSLQDNGLKEVAKQDLAVVLYWWMQHQQVAECSLQDSGKFLLAFLC